MGLIISFLEAHSGHVVWAVVNPPKEIVEARVYALPDDDKSGILFVLAPRVWSRLWRLAEC